MTKEQKSILLIVFLIVILLAMGVGGFYWWQSITERQKAEEVIPATIPEEEKEVDETAGWKTYIDKKYGISFKYPNDWSKPKVDDLEKGEPFAPIDYRFLDFTGGETGVGEYRIQAVDLSRYSAYQGTHLESELEGLEEVYQTKDVSGSKTLWLPFGNAAVIASTKPEYLETADGGFRGIYYFANIGQAYTTDIDCLIILTDGQSKIFQLHMTKESDKSSQYQIKPEADYEQESKRFLSYIRTLDIDTSTETIVKEFNTIYRNIALSVESID